MSRVISPSHILLAVCISLNFFLITDALGEFGSGDDIIRDETMIVPGLGSNGIVIGEDIEAVLQRFGKQKFRISKPSQVNELFKNVFKIASDTKIYFDSIYYNDYRKCAACVFQGRVIAVIGFDSNCVTKDAVNLESGINNFIFNYGNKNMIVLRSGTNGMYIYSALGIALADDDMNDSIDLFIVFAPPAGKNN